jgi:predicted GTPase
MEESINGLEAHLQQLAIPIRDEGPFQESYERTRQAVAALLRAIEEKVHDREDLRGQLREHTAMLFQPLRLFVAGEFSKGKSYLINVLCGNETVRETNIGPQDTKITILTHGDARNDTSSRYVDVKHYPFPFLKLINLVDSPGINAALRPEHTRITQEHVASADLILFVTSAERTVSQEEIDLIRFIAQHNKSEVVFIVNKVDVFEDSLIDFVDQEGKTALIRFLEQTLARETSLRDPLIFSVSTRRAMWAIVNRNAEVWKRSGIEAFINHLGQILQSGDAALLKLRSPLNYLEGEHIDGLPILQGLEERTQRLITGLEQSRITIQRVEEGIRLQVGEIQEAIDDFKFDEIERDFEQSIDRFLEKFLLKESLHAFKNMTKDDQLKHVQRELNEAFVPWEKGVDAKKLTYVENILRHFERCWAHANQTLQAESSGILRTLIEEREVREGKTVAEAFEFERQNVDLVRRFETLKRDIRQDSQSGFEDQALDAHNAIEKNMALFTAISATAVAGAVAGIVADLFVSGGILTVISLLAGGGGIGGALALRDNRAKRIREQMQESTAAQFEAFRTSFNEKIRKGFREEAEAFRARCERIFVQRLREIVDDEDGRG